MSTNQRGFTIVELLISTTIFSLVLLLCVAAATQMGRYFYKGISESRSQNTNRQIMDSIANAIQFSGDIPIIKTGQTVGPVGGITVLCLGDVRYSFVTNFQQDDNVSYVNASGVQKIRHVLWQDTGAKATGCSAADLTKPTPYAGGQEMVSAGMRLTQLDVSNTYGQLWDINLRIMYGDNSTMDTSTTPYTCLGTRQGGDFCGSSVLNTSVYRRLI